MTQPGDAKCYWKDCGKPVEPGAEFCTEHNECTRSDCGNPRDSGSNFCAGHKP